VKATIGPNQKISAFFNTTAFYRGASPVTKSTVTLDGVPSSAITFRSALPGWTMRQATASVTLTAVAGVDFEIEFTTGKPLPYISEVKARTYVSHWGKSKQSTFYEVQNAGPKFVGEFNRIDFTQNSPCCLQAIPLRPPATREGSCSAPSKAWHRN
jgi:hypothetical protein